jgi:hypothetical protein
MIAIVDHHVELLVVIRAATSTRLPRRLVHDDVLAALREPDSGGKAGQSGAYDVNRARHQMNA